MHVASHMWEPVSSLCRSVDGLDRVHLQLVQGTVNSTHIATAAICVALVNELSDIKRE